MKSTLICSTYNQPRFLELVLDSMLYQTTPNFDLIIADDGSKKETTKVIKSFLQKASFNIKHLWHEDIGWQKSKIHNEALKVSKNEHIIFIDGDCVLGVNFIKDHQEIFKEERNNFLFMGRRIDLGPKITKTLNVDNYRNKLLSSFPSSLIYSAIGGDSKHIARRFTFASPLIRKIIKANAVFDLLGCNFSTTRTKLLEINGFDEDIQDKEGGGEDGDLFIRLQNTGIKLIGMKYYAEMYHLWHPRGQRLNAEQMYFKRLKFKNYVWTKNGVIKS